jgi:predicted ArsR family transcriptional regulator
MKTSRQRLLNYLRKKQVATVREISLALKMTPANARHHLSILIEQGSVESTGKHIGPGPGRPYILYRVAKSDSKNNLNDLSHILLEGVLEGKSVQERDDELRKIAHKLIKGDVQSGKQQSRRLNDAIQQLTQMNYDARWEAHHDAPHIILENCPYIDIINNFPEICRMNKFIIEKLLGNTVNQSVKLEAMKSGLHRCIFILNKE